MVRPRTTESQRSYELGQEAWSSGQLTAAFRLFLDAANRGAKQAYRVVAQFYHFGDGTRKNKEEALLWYRRAHRDCSDAVAANNIGCILRDRGEIQRALWWFRRAVRLGDDEAHLNIAKIHFRRKDRNRAVRHLRELLEACDVTEGTREEAERLIGGRSVATVRPKVGRRRPRRVGSRWGGRG